MRSHGNPGGSPPPRSMKVPRKRPERVAKLLDAWRGVSVAGASTSFQIKQQFELSETRFGLLVRTPIQTGS